MLTLAASHTLSAAELPPVVDGAAAAVATRGSPASGGVWLDCIASQSQPNPTSREASCDVAERVAASACLGSDRLSALEVVRVPIWPPMDLILTLEDCGLVHQGDGWMLPSCDDLPSALAGLLGAWRDEPPGWCPGADGLRMVHECVAELGRSSRPDGTRRALVHSGWDPVSLVASAAVLSTTPARVAVPD